MNGCKGLRPVVKLIGLNSTEFHFAVGDKKSKTSRKSCLNKVHKIVSIPKNKKILDRINRINKIILTRKRVLTAGDQIIQKIQKV